MGRRPIALALDLSRPPRCLLPEPNFCSGPTRDIGPARLLLSGTDLVVRLDDGPVLSPHHEVGAEPRRPREQPSALGRETAQLPGASSGHEIYSQKRYQTTPYIQLTAVSAS